MAIVFVPVRTVVLSLASDPSQTLTLKYVVQVNRTPQTPGETRMYGAGRYSGLSAGATQKQIAVAANAVEPADVAKLESWDGQTLLYRDDQDRMFGLYRSPAINRHQYDQNADVSFTFQQLTYDEGV